MRIALANMLAALLSTVTVTTLFYILLLSPYFSITILSKPISTTAIAKHNATTVLAIGTTTTNTGDFNSSLMSWCYSCTNIKVMPWINGYSSVTCYISVHTLQKWLVDTWCRSLIIMSSSILSVMVSFTSRSISFTSRSSCCCYYGPRYLLVWPYTDNNSIYFNR